MLGPVAVRIDTNFGVRKRLVAEMMERSAGSRYGYQSWQEAAVDVDEN